jgi:propanol-preferring alcohol dehydrogenase
VNLPSSMRALRLEAWTSAPVLVEVAVPVPTGDEVLLRVDAAGLCQSDLHVMDAPAGLLPYPLPFTLGHEIAGTVVGLGDTADTDWLGAACLVHGVWGCGACRNCLRGRDNYCLRLAGGPVGGGLGRDGGLAEFVLVPNTRHLVRNPDLDPVAAAPLTDAGLTALHAVSEYRHLAANGTTLLIGSGGLGHLALQLLLAEPDPYVVVVDTRASARELATSLGAAGVAAHVSAGLELLAASGRGAGADLVVDFVGAAATLGDVPEALAPGGALVVVGSGGGAVEAAKGRRLPQGWRMSAPFWGPRADLVRVVELAHEGVLQAETSIYPLTGALDAYRELREGHIHGRAVVRPNTAAGRAPRTRAVIGREQRKTT